MIKNLFLFAAIAGLVMFWAQNLQAKFGTLDTDSIQSPVVVELFTSQSCSSCPPADRLLNEIGKNENIIALGFHVTYWNHLHWKDTLSQEFATQRQRNYSAHKRSNRVYTPQMIVNGAREFVGSNRSKLNAAITDAKKLQPITLRKTGTDIVEITLPKRPKDGALNYSLRLFGVKDKTTVEIQRGENRGRTVNYANAVIHEQTLSPWLGQADTRIVTIPKNADIDTIIAIAQIGGYGEIVAAGKLQL